MYNFSLLNTIRYDTKEEFNVDSKADDQLNLTHVARKMKKKKLKQTNASAYEYGY